MNIWKAPVLFTANHFTDNDREYWKVLKTKRNHYGAKLALHRKAKLGTNIVIVWHTLADNYLPQRGPTCKVQSTQDKH